jgi:hypothetical protein
VGDDYFQNLSRAFLNENPPRSKLMFELGEGFPEFVATQNHGLDYLSDIAKIEILWRESYHETDATSLTIADFQVQDLSRVGEMRFDFHPSLRIFAFNMASFSIYADVMGLSNNEFNVSEKEEGVIIRPNLEVEAFLMPPSSSLVLAKLQQGFCLAEAFEALDNFDINSFLQILITKNIITGINL